MKSLRFILGAWIVAILMTACGDGSSPTRDIIIATVSVIDGNNQSATVGTELLQPLVALVLNKSGEPISGQIVNFVVTGGGGAVFAGAAESDANGYVRERWTLGTATGTQTVELRCVDSNGAAVVFTTFTATATADAPQYFVIGSGDDQIASQLQPLPQPLEVIVTDKYGNPVPGVPVTFIADNGGTVQPATATTNASGIASATWTLGIAMGSQSLTVSTDGLPPVTFSATATQVPPGAPVALTIAAGNSQTIMQHSRLPVPLKVVVTDQLGIIVPGVGVTFAAGAGSGYIKPATVVTDSWGIASWLGYLHVAGQETVDATVPGISGVTFTITVTPSSHLYDGWYMCSITNSSITYFQLPVIEGVITSNGEGRGSNNQNHIVGNGNSAGQINEVDGTFTANLDIGYGPTDPLGLHLSLTGQLTVDTLQQGTGSGTHQNTVTGATGTWTCERLYKW